MMKAVHFLTLLLAPLFAIGQEPAPVTHSWTVSAMGAAAVTYRTLLDKEGSELSGVIIDQRNDVEDPRFGYDGDLLLQRHFGPQWTLGIGISYKRLGYQNDYDVSDLTFGDTIDPRRGFIYANTNTKPLASIRSIDDYHYIGLTVQVERSWGLKRLHPLVGMALVPSYMVQASTISHYVYEDGSSDRHSNDFRPDFRTFNLFASVEAGCAYDAGSRMQVRLLPYGSMGLLEMIDAPVSARLWSVGVQAGVAYRL